MTEYAETERLMDEADAQGDDGEFRGDSPGDQSQGGESGLREQADGA